MLPQVSYLLLVLLVAGSQCAPAKIGGGFNIGASGEAGLKGGASVRAGLEEPFLLYPGVTGMVGADTKGGLHGGGYAFLNDKVVGADGEVKGNVAGQLKDVFEGDVGIDKHGNAVLGGTNRVSAAGDIGGGANFRAATNKDALDYIKWYGGESAKEDFLKIY